MMPRKFLTAITLMSALLPLASCDSALKASTSSFADAEKIVLTDVDFDPESLVPETQPVADYLAANLGDAKVEGTVEIAPDSDTVAQWIASGKTDLYFDSIYPIMKVMEQSGGTPILRRWKDNAAEYNTYIVARRDRGITDLADLKGKMIALEDPDSSSGFMFPMVAMLNVNLNPVEKAEANHPVAADEIGYIFSGEDETTAEWVLNGKVMAGAIDNEAFAEIPEEDRNQLVIIAETEMYPRHIVLAASDLTEQQIEDVKAVLLGMDETEAGQAALKEFSETAQFDELPADTISRLQSAYDLLQNHLKQRSL